LALKENDPVIIKYAKKNYFSLVRTYANKNINTYILDRINNLLFVGSVSVEVIDITTFFNTKITNSYLEGNIKGFELDADLNSLIAISDSIN
jgi:hypothetical protein